ncbi:hypothetical protein LEP1GSC041_0410 [Leptospira noguchii str. 2006001870]|nr:hypothetical protein LEP1GSC041_0410 [Leptospira noguchii str. 2006001870]
MNICYFSVLHDRFSINFILRTCPNPKRCGNSHKNLEAKVTIKTRKLLLVIVFVGTTTF